MLRPVSVRRLRAGAALAFALLAGSTACGTSAGTAPRALEAPVESAAPSAPPALPPAPGAVPGPETIPLRPAVPAAAAHIPQPVRVQVEGTGIDLEVVPAGIEDNGAMSLPDNHYQAAWYRYGPAPGADEGSSVLAAHVDSRTEQLPIAGLKDVAAGTIVTVTREDGSMLRYATESVENIAKKSLDGHRLFDRTGAAQLKLVTCGGEWLQAQDDYADNVVLTAAPVS